MKENGYVVKILNKVNVSYSKSIQTNLCSIYMKDLFLMAIKADLVDKFVQTIQYMKVSGHMTKLMEKVG